MMRWLAQHRWQNALTISSPGIINSPIFSFCGSNIVATYPRRDLSMRFKHCHASFCRARAALWALPVFIAGALLLTATAFGGTWTPLAATAPGEVELMLLLPDGTVMAANQPAFGTDVGRAWFRLT